MLIASRDRVQKLKSAGKSAQEAVAEKPFADLALTNKLTIAEYGAVNRISALNQTMDAAKMKGF